MSATKEQKIPLLQELLELGLISLDGKEERYTYLEETAAALAKDLKAKKALIIPATLVALDPEADENEPSFEFAENALKSRWKLLRNSERDRPRTMLRVLLFVALMQASAGDARVQQVVWQSAASILPYLALGREKSVFYRELERIGIEAEKAAIAAFQVSNAAEPAKNDPPSAIKVEPLAGVTLKAEYWARKLAAAVGPQDTQGQIPDGNRYWPQINSAETRTAWVTDFGDRMSKVLSEQSSTISSDITGKVTEALREFAKKIAASQKDQVDALRSIVTEAATANEYAQLRQDVLWWKEALYSTTLRCSYRALPKATAVVAMAHDLFQVVPAIVPESVVYLLAEAVHQLLGDVSTIQQPILEFLTQIRAEARGIQDIVNQGPKGAYRIPLLGLVELVVHGQEVSSALLHEHTGLSQEIRLSPAELAMWCFRDLQARHNTKDPK